MTPGPVPALGRRRHAADPSEPAAPAISRDRKGANTNPRTAALRDESPPPAPGRGAGRPLHDGHAAASRKWRERARKLAASNRELERFASKIAHDLRAPLRHLAQFSEFLAADLDGGATPAVSEHLSVIRASAARMTQMVDRQLEYARVGVGAPRLRPVALAACFAEAKAAVGAQADGVDIAAHFGAHGFARADRALLIRLFQSLLRNLLKLHRPGLVARVRVVAEGDARTVTLAFETDALELERVTASGAGDDDGLAICKRICETIGGTLARDMSSANCARFVVRLARARPPRKTAPRA